MLTAEEVENIVRRALAPLEAEVRELKVAILGLDDPATSQQVEDIVEERVFTAIAPVVAGLAQLGAKVRPVRTRGQRAVDEVFARAAKALRPPPPAAGAPTGSTRQRKRK